MWGVFKMGVQVRCSKCGKTVDVDKLAEHVAGCCPEILQTEVKSKTMRVPASKIEVV